MWFNWTADCIHNLLIFFSLHRFCTSAIFYMSVKIIIIQKHIWTIFDKSSSYPDTLRFFGFESAILRNIITLFKWSKILMISKYQFLLFNSIKYKFLQCMWPPYNGKCVMASSRLCKTWTVRNICDLYFWPCIFIHIYLQTFALFFISLVIYFIYTSMYIINIFVGRKFIFVLFFYEKKKLMAWLYNVYMLFSVHSYFRFLYFMRLLYFFYYAHVILWPSSQGNTIKGT